jgi:hypothetical protein
MFTTLVLSNSEALELRRQLELSIANTERYIAHYTRLFEVKRHRLYSEAIARETRSLGMMRGMLDRLP